LLPAEGEELLIKLNVVPRMAERLEGAEIEDRIALGMDGGQDGRGDRDVDAAQAGERLNGGPNRTGRGSSHCQSLADLLFAVADQVMDDALRLPADNDLQVHQRQVSAADRRPGLKGGFFKLVLLLAGFLPIVLCQLLKLGFCSLKFKCCHGVSSSIWKNHDTIGPVKNLCQ